MRAANLMVIVGERPWTEQAIHLACTLARQHKGTISLVNLVPVRHPLMLGTDAAYLNFTAEDEAKLRDLAATIEDYNVPYTVYVCGYASYQNAVKQFADTLDAAVVFAAPPSGSFPLWSQVQTWLSAFTLAHNLARHGHLLFTLAPTTNDWSRLATWLDGSPLELFLEYSH
jgi:hypothetical protein